MNEKKRSRRKVVTKRKFSALLASLLLIFAVGVCGTAAYLITNTEPVTNTFIAATQEPEVDEKINKGVKESVKITNGGNVDAYIRANVIVTWQDQDGNVYGQLPVEGTDYYMVIPANDKWVKAKDGYYYYLEPVAAGKQTEDLLTDGKLLLTDNIPEGYELSIEILAQSIQAVPHDAVENAWSSGVASVNETTNVLNIKYE